jgi:hypothetical protein
VTNHLSSRGATHPIDRFRKDFSRRYAKLSQESEARPVSPEVERKPLHRLDKLPPEIGVLLLVVGTAGILLPGPVGSPFLVAGGLALWPSGFRKVEDWFQRVAPGVFETGMQQMERFLSDLERRYPGSSR